MSRSWQNSTLRTGQTHTLAYFGHHKCASMWIRSVLSSISDEIGIQHHLINDYGAPQAAGPLSDSRGTFSRSMLGARAEQAGADLVICMAADQAQAQSLQPYRGFHVIRDPRDIIVSAYFSHRNSHPTELFPHLQLHRERLQATSLEEGLVLEMDFSRVELMQIGDWDYHNPAILEVKMDRLIRRPYSTFIRIFRHLNLLNERQPVKGREQVWVWISRLLNRASHRPGLGCLRRPMPVPADLLLGTIYAQRFETLAAGREQGTEDAMNHYRKGISGDWVNYFTPEHLEEFDARFGDLPARLGYEMGEQ